MSAQFCPECQRATAIVHDHAAGDLVCAECGLVLEAHSIDETSEWRTFADDASGADPNRVGGPANPLLTDGGLSTVISRPAGAAGGPHGSADGGGLRSWAARGPDPDRALITAFKSIAAMADSAGAYACCLSGASAAALEPSRIDRAEAAVTPLLKQDRANELFKKVGDLRAIRGRSQDSILAACLYIACRQEDKPRTFKEICSVANAATKKDIGRATTYIVKQLEEEMGLQMRMGTINAGDYLRRFCSHLSMDNNAIRATSEVVTRAGAKLDLRKSPISIAAAAIYIVKQLSDKRTNLKEISQVTGVAEVTIRSAYKDLHPHAAVLVPDWFAKPDQLSSLLPPPREKEKDK
eukprot:SM000036S13277  [mRNA]  locus=s36:376827:379170:+ [translate_table: standard]